MSNVQTGNMTIVVMFSRSEYAWFLVYFPFLGEKVGLSDHQEICVP
jgi:hypothetical protein